eukprot:m.85883 g.85883  ORF g.85883 m.85883 type:complete len:219 (+) comp21293_c0_seq2:100-756(+)
MSLINVTNVGVLNNPARFTDPLQFEIVFECLKELESDIEWKIIYVGSADSEDHDQELDSVLVGSFPVGCNKFVFQADPPDAQKIPVNELVGVTIVLLTCSYKEQEFIRVGYYVNTDYADPGLRENPPPVPIVDALWRNILAAKPRVTRFPIMWDDDEKENVEGDEDEEALAAYYQQAEQEQDEQDDDEQQEQEEYEDNEAEEADVEYDLGVEEQIFAH